MTDSAPAAFANYQNELVALQQRWMDYPMLVSIETSATCNATCEFCPYPILEHKGARLTEEQFDKILADLSSVPDKFPWMMTLCRVNEPLLDKRIFNFYKKINDTFPKTMTVFHTNASALNEKNTDSLLNIKRLTFIKVSLNASDEDEYRKVMGLDFNNTIKNLRNLHARAERGELRVPIILGRVEDRSDRDKAFLDFCAANFPLFRHSLTPRGDWMGMVSGFKSPSPNVGCKQWFELHILANGKEAMCCIDADGRHGHGPMLEHPVLDRYNSPEKRQLRETLPDRNLVPACVGCSMLA